MNSTRARNRQIVHEHAMGIPQCQIAAQYGISPSRVSQILYERGRSDLALRRHASLCLGLWQLMMTRPELRSLARFEAYRHRRDFIRQLEYRVRTFW